MTHTYTITGMTCGGCEAKVKSVLQSLDHVQHVEVSLEDDIANITMDKHISLIDLKKALKPLGNKYQISAQHQREQVVQKNSWFDTYKPILLIFVYILGITLIIQFTGNGFNFSDWMRHFMAGFFLVFSFFKLLNLKGFVNSYAMYDVVAMKFPVWGYLYAILELILGIAFLINFNPIVTSGVTFVVMSISIIGVLRSVLNKQKIQCACLGDVFNLPMSTVTIVEDGLMIVMSLGMLIMAF